MITIKDKDLFKRVKIFAAERGIKIYEIVEEAIAKYLKDRGA